MKRVHDSQYQLGMTLLEVLIALSIFATITAITTQALRQAITNNSKIQTQLDEMSQVRDALTLIQSDIRLAGPYWDIEKDYLETAKQLALKNTPGPNTPTPPNGFGLPGAPLPPAQNPPASNPPLTPEMRLQIENRFNLNQQNRISPTTHFSGSAEKLSFVTTNPYLYRPNNNPQEREAPSGPQPIPHFIKVSYQLQDCPYLKDTRCVIRYAETENFENMESLRNGMMVLSGVTELKFRYLGRGQQDWVDRWNTQGASATQQNRFPNAVEVQLVLESGQGNNKKRVSMTTKTYLHFPNPPPERRNNSNPGVFR